ncbi:MAG: hypothetical protein U0641_07085 [Anaerolineae bacterium]
MTEIIVGEARPQSPLVVGVDVGGTKTAAAVVDAAGAAVRARADGDAARWRR